MYGRSSLILVSISLLRESERGCSPLRLRCCSRCSSSGLRSFGLFFSLMLSLSVPRGPTPFRVDFRGLDFTEQPILGSLCQLREHRIAQEHEALRYGIAEQPAGHPGVECKLIVGGERVVLRHADVAALGRHGPFWKQEPMLRLHAERIPVLRPRPGPRPARPLARHAHQPDPRRVIASRRPGLPRRGGARDRGARRVRSCVASAHLLAQGLPLLRGPCLPARPRPRAAVPVRHFLITPDLIAVLIKARDSWSSQMTCLACGLDRAHCPFRRSFGGYGEEIVIGPPVA